MGDLSIGSMAIFLGFVDRCPHRIEQLRSADLVEIAGNEGEDCFRAFPIDEAGERLPGRADEIVWKEELLPLPRTGFTRDERERAMINAHGYRLTLAEIIRAPGSKQFNDVRDRAAFTHVTGTCATHMRPQATGLLWITTEPVGEVPPLGGRGPVRLSHYYFDKLALDTHPMVKAVGRKIAEAWDVCTFTGPNDRASFQRVFMRRGDEKQRVQVDGSVLLGWGRGRASYH